MLSYKYYVTVCGNTQSKFLPRFLYARIPLQSHVTVSIIRNSCVPIGVPSRYVEKTSQDMRLPLLTIASTGVCPTTWSSSRDLYILPAWYCGRYQIGDRSSHISPKPNPFIVDMTASALSCCSDGTYRRTKASASPPWENCMLSIRWMNASCLLSFSLPCR